MSRIDELDVVIIGAGPAGMSAAIWAANLKLRHVAIDRGPTVGGQLHRVFNKIADYPGFEGGVGEDLAERFLAQALDVGVNLETGTAVLTVDCANGVVATNERTYLAASLVIATGVTRRTLGIPGESDFVGRGLSPSASKYAGEFVGKSVVVVGGGDAACEEALILARACSRVTLIHRSDSFPRVRRDFRERVAQNASIDVLTNSSLLAIEGGDRVESVRITKNGHEVRMPVDGVFICVGVEPASTLVRSQLDVDQCGAIVVDSRQRSSIRNVYAVGDVCANSSLTIASAVGQGAAAVKDIQRRLSAIVQGP